MKAQPHDTLNDDYQRIAQAINWIAAHRKSQPSVAQMAASVALSESHFSRLFRRWAGISPQRYLATLTLDIAKQALRASSNVEQAAWASGLSGAGRLHDTFVRIDAVSPGEFKRQGAGLTLRYAFASTQFGDGLLVMSERGIVALRLGAGTDRVARLTAVKDEWPEAALIEDASLADRLRTLVGQNDKTAQPVDVVLQGTPFQHKVWQALLAIGVGETVSYGALAERIGRPGASRAVGSAVGANSVALLIPCHRVLRASGDVGGYRWGVPRKQTILAWEQCQRLVNTG